MKLVNYHVEDRLAYITLNRPEKRNALNFQMVEELKMCFSEAENDENVKVIILSGIGEAFCAGADLEYLQQLQNNTFDENLKDSVFLKDLYYQIYTLSKVVIAKVKGYAIAGGCGLASVCDFIYASEDAKFGYTEVKIGFVPAIVMTFLLRKVGEMKAKEVLLSGDLIHAEKALQMGIINKVFSLNELDGEVEDFAKHLIKTNSSQGMALTKQMIAAVQSKSLNEALHYAAEKNAR
ncbi:MAG: enoyl-CoA hydratase/isomerase family protein, partial [Cyclobacteriaceae bacterium]|nr:enoyl-CoA hydratase/isomerase family protein [Cyclobacteriaceae bacterium]